MAAIFAMTWVVKPKEIAYQSQTERFEHLLTKLNLSDGQGKIRDVANCMTSGSPWF